MTVGAYQRIYLHMRGTLSSFHTFNLKPLAVEAEYFRIVQIRPLHKSKAPYLQPSKRPLSPLLLTISLFLGKSMADQSTNPLIMDAKSVHPLHQIAETPTHRLLLKQWLKEEELILNRISLKETQIDGVRREITQLYCFFFIFHSTLLILLFNNSSSNPNGSACHRSWIPSLCSLLCSLGFIWAVRYKTDVESHMEKLLEREKEDGKLLGKCVEELKKKGVEFDLLKEVDALRRAKSLRVEAKAVRKWSARDFVTFFFFTVSCLVLGLKCVWMGRKSRLFCAASKNLGYHEPLNLALKWSHLWDG
ncbi:hypothetical protein CK203_082244 [Vitis vinifera]|uniref:Uncharacterized protein n=1 Tax=Vitis vinifera TaxID=29760 RepID=A0A438CND5_VITVI|nr:hypothetical protein CK203_082244 [Vitis vinifera]